VVLFFLVKSPTTNTCAATTTVANAREAMVLEGVLADVLMGDIGMMIGSNVCEIILYEKIKTTMQVWISIAVRTDVTNNTVVVLEYVL